MKSTETTKGIMNRYFEHQRVPYSIMTLLGEPLGYKQRLPYVVGETFFVPDRGPTKQSASWYALHHVSYAIPQADELLLYCEQHLILTLPLKQAAFDKQLDRTARLYHMQQKWPDEYIRNNEYIKLNLSKENIVHRRLKCNAYPCPEFTAYDFLMLLIHYHTQNVLHKIFGEGNPHWENAKKHFQLPPRHL